MFVHRLGEDGHVQLLEPRHAEAYFHMIEANRAHIGSYVRTPARLASVAETRANLQRLLDGYAAGSSVTVGIWCEDVLVGEAGLRLDHRDRCASLGYFIAEGAQGRGLITRTCRALIDHAFGALDFHRVELQAEVGNQRSRAVAERLGFQLEGVRRGGQLLHGAFVDMALYGLVRPEA